MGLNAQRYATINERLIQRAEETPDRVIYRHLERGEALASMTYAELHARVQSVAAAVQHAGHAPGARVAIFCAPGFDYTVAFWGCLYAGVIAVPVYPAWGEAAVRRTEAIFRDAGVTGVLSTAPLASALAAFEWADPALHASHWVCVDAVPPALAPLADREPDDVAFLQYTSGSTGEPKGVMVNHRCLMANADWSRRFVAIYPDTVSVAWLPPYHDMGLIGFLMQAVYSGSTHIGMSPMDFLAEPYWFLRAISDYGGTLTAMPNFGYELALRKVTEEQRDTLDLSTWNQALNGSEPVRLGTMQRFREYFAPCGLDPRALRPTYGLAEGTLLVSIDPPGSEVTARELDGRTIVAAGAPVGELDIQIVDPGTAERCPVGEVGEIWISGASVAAGYWGRPELTAATFEAELDDEPGTRFLRTGDLGLLEDGALFITGRLKDVIIVRGRNLYPQDIEQRIDDLGAALRPSCCVAVPIETADGEGVAVAAEISRDFDPATTAETTRRIRDAVLETTGVAPALIALVPAKTLPKTTSGKLRRYVVAQALADATLQAIPGGLWRQDPARASA